MCNRVLLLCIAIIMTSDFLLDLMLCRNFDGNVFCEVIETAFPSCSDLSCRMFSNVVFFNEFLHSCIVKTTLSYVKLRLFSVSFEKMNNCLWIAPKTPMQTRNKEWPIALCRYGAPFFAIQFSGRIYD